MTGVVCNYCAICIDLDCKFDHPNIPNIKDRRVVRKLYDGLVAPNKVEPNPEKRRANCRFGQICFNSNCGFRHRLAFSDRMKLVNGFNQAKLETVKSVKPVGMPKVKGFLIESKNTFTCLECDDSDVIVAKISWDDICNEQMTFEDFPVLARN